MNFSERKEHVNVKVDLKRKEKLLGSSHFSSRMSKHRPEKCFSN